MDAVPEILKAGGYGVVTFLCLAVIAFVRGWVVPGKLYEQELAERKEWQRIALQGRELKGEVAGLAKMARELTP